MHSANCTIPLLENTEMEIFIRAHTIEVVARESLENTKVELSGHWSKFHAKVTTQLSPVPRVFIEASFNIPSLPLLDYGRTVKLRLPDGPEIEARVEACGTLACWSLLVPSRPPVTIMQTEKKVQYVKFKVINYPGVGCEKRPALLEPDPWVIKICPLPDLKESKKKLSSDSGYALTHKGVLKRSDGNSFSIEDAKETLGKLRLLLSFARGGNCGLTLISGNNENDERVWEQWGSYHAFPWFDISSWIDHRRRNSGSALSKACLGFFKKLGKLETGQPEWFRIALFWYLRSNETDDPHTGIISAQAALERLASKVLNKSGKSRSKSKLICEALEQIGVDLKIPETCRELRKTYRNDLNGPKAFVNTRNSLVHSKMSKSVSLDGYSEARDLGQWYVELLLLKLIGYEGQYINRLTYNYGGKWEFEAMPWLCSKDKAS